MAKTTEKPKKTEEPNCCGNCGFGQDANFTKHDVKVFACRRFPPHQTGSQQRPERYPFPMVAATEWCGEHQRKEADSGEEKN